MTTQTRARELELLAYHAAQKITHPGAPDRTPEELAEFKLRNWETWRQAYRTAAVEIERLETALRSERADIVARIHNMADELLADGEDWKAGIVRSVADHLSPERESES